MGFLDNSGDIILDAVLTDTGRFRLAKGDGSFKIAKFALADDEVDYLLDNDIKRVKEELSDEYYWFGGLNEARQHAMIDISFNLGQTRLRGFKKALDAMATEDFDRAADEFMDSRWAEQVKSRAPEVTEMIRTGEYA